MEKENPGGERNGGKGGWIYIVTFLVITRYEISTLRDRAY